VVKALQILEEELPRYISEVKSKPTENSKAMAFSSFIQKVFDIQSSELDFEVPVKTEMMELRGRIDAVFGNLIFEFKRDIRKSQETAEEELLKYFQAYYEKYNDVRYLGIANDGIKFLVYQSILENNVVARIEKIGELNLENSTPKEVFLWFDSYLFTSKKIEPTSEDLKKRFGLDSPTFASIRKQLGELFEKVHEYKPVKIKYESWTRYLEIVYGDKPRELDLFLTHTYLSTFVKLLVYLKLSGNMVNRIDQIPPILYGNTFSQFGVQDFLEEDFFAWIMFIAIRKKASEIFSKLLRALEVYDLDKVDEDVLKELYQELIGTEVRKQLGEYYTPDWLAEDMVNRILADNPYAKVLDPSCGSGTFLFKTIRYKIDSLLKDGLDKSKILQHILESVVGFDVHPIAAIISKTNYLLALKDLLNSRTGSINIPVFLSDSLKIPTKKIDVSNPIVTFEFEALNRKFLFPVSVASDFSKMDHVVEQMKNHGHAFEEQLQKIRESSYSIQDAIPSLRNNLIASFERSISNIVNKDEKEILVQNIRVLFNFIQDDENSIWTYVIRNMYKPVSISYKKTDVLIGNPPWITMRAIKDEIYQDYVKSRSSYYNIMDTYNFQNIASTELASLFFCQCVDQYLEKDGLIAFVMPQSVLIASHHEKFRKFTNPKVKLTHAYDLDKVKPLFRIPSCVLFGKKNESTKYPIPLTKISGTLPSTNLQLKDASPFLVREESVYEPITRQKKGGYYYDKFNRGAEITPRNFWFVDIKTNKLLSFNPAKPFVTSSENQAAHLPWKTLKVEGNVEKQFFFNTVLGEDLIPFGYLRRRLIILPILVERDNIKMISASSLEISQFDFVKYLKKIDELWMKYGTEKLKKKPIYEQINYNGNLENQKPTSKYKVLYVANGTNMTSCVLKPKEKHSLSLDESNFVTDTFFADMAVYYFNTESENEAYYLSSILNSKTINEFIKQYQSRGDFGARNIHKAPLVYDIPKYDENDSSHKTLVDIGKKCEIKAKEIASGLHFKNIGKIRTAIRNSLTEELGKIDTIVKKF